MGVAKNIILFIADGMGISTVTAARILKGQLQGRSGEEEELSFDKMPHMGLVKTYCTDFQTPDSSATATAILSGVKTNKGVVGLDERVQRANCSAQISLNANVKSALQLSADNGKSTGIVTNTRLTHATPAACYAHAAERYWDDDSLTPSECTDIALQLIELNPYIEASLTWLESGHGKGTCDGVAGAIKKKADNLVKAGNVLLGGGRRHFEPTSSYKGRRFDGRNLINEWGAEKTSRGLTSEFVENRQQLNSVDPSKTDYLLGIFSTSHMDYEVDKDPDSDEPSVSEMTEKSIQILQKNDKGFFLFVEGGRIDTAHHKGTAGRALHEVIEFDRAVETALKMVNQSETLIIVTSDHSHAMVIAGNQKKGNPILGLSDPTYLGSDGLPYTTLMYGTGYGYPDAYDEGHRKNLYKVDTAHKDYRQAAAVPRTATHSGEDVPVYARGPMSHLLTGVHEQSYIAHVMMYASCVGLNKSHCARDNDQHQVNNVAEWHSTTTTQKADIDEQNRFRKVVDTGPAERDVLVPSSASILGTSFHFVVVLATSLQLMSSM